MSFLSNKYVHSYYVYIRPRADHFLMALANPDGSFTGTMYADDETPRPDGTSKLCDQPRVNSNLCSVGEYVQVKRSASSISMMECENVANSRLRRLIGELVCTQSAQDTYRTCWALSSSRTNLFCMLMTRHHVPMALWETSVICDQAWVMTCDTNKNGM